MSEIKEIEQKIHATISKIELAMSDFSIRKENTNQIKEIENDEIQKKDNENSVLKEKLIYLKKEHQKDLDKLNNIIKELNSFLGEENV
tara:strand:- start:209 stop:472 length:264 start_codon:yes stop_codon:yes gene_type:complete